MTTTASEVLHGRRSVVTVEQRIAVGTVIGLAAAAGAFTAPEPTGAPVVDAVYRAAWVVTIGLAGSRARRWSLVVGSTLCAVASLGVFLIAAIAALVLSVALVGKDQRNRVYGAVVGSLVGFSTLGLSIGGFEGLETVIAAAAAVMICWSGFRNSSRVVRRRWRWVAVGLAAFWIVGTAAAGALVLLDRGPLQAGVDSTVDGIAAIRDGDSDAAVVRLDAAASDFGDAAGIAGAPWFLPARVVPVVAQNSEVVRVVAEEGERLTSSAARVLTDVDYDRLSRPEGGIDLVVLDEFVDPVVDGSRQVGMAQLAVQGLDSPWIVAPLRSELDEFAVELADVADDASLAELALNRAPSLLGGDPAVGGAGPRTYLVLLANPAEARDLGGHIGNWAEIRVDDGDLELVEVGRPLELSQPDADAELRAAGDVPEAFLAMQPGRYPQNWGATPDMYASASVAARLFERQRGVPVDGVIYADPHVLAAMLEIIGPVPVPGLPDTVVDSSNVVEFLTRGQYTAFPDKPTADDGVTELVEDIFETFVSTRLPSPEDIGALFGDLARERRLRFISMNPEDRALLERTNLSVALPVGDDHDLLSIVSRNANPSKIDSFLRRESVYRVDWDPETGQITARVEVTLHNDAPTDGYPDIVIGNSGGRFPGTNVTTLGVITPFELDSVLVDGSAHPVSPVWEGEWWRHTVRVEVPAGGSVSIAMTLRGDLPPNDSYSLATIGQALLDPGPLDVIVRTPERQFVDGPDVDVGEHSASVSLELLGDGVVRLETE